MKESSNTCKEYNDREQRRKKLEIDANNINKERKKGATNENKNKKK